MNRRTPSSSATAPDRHRAPTYSSAAKSIDDGSEAVSSPRSRSQHRSVSAQSNRTASNTSRGKGLLQHAVWTSTSFAPATDGASSAGGGRSLSRERRTDETSPPEHFTITELLSFDSVRIGNPAGSVRLASYKSDSVLVGQSAHGYQTPFSALEPVSVSLSDGHLSIERFRAFSSLGAPRGDSAESAGGSLSIMSLSFDAIGKIEATTTNTLRITAKDHTEIVLAIHLAPKLTLLFKYLTLRCRGTMPITAAAVTQYYDESTRPMPNGSDAPRISSIAQPLLQHSDYAPPPPATNLDALGHLRKGYNPYVPVFPAKSAQHRDPAAGGDGSRATRISSSPTPVSPQKVAQGTTATPNPTLATGPGADSSREIRRKQLVAQLEELKRKARQ